MIIERSAHICHILVIVGPGKIINPALQRKPENQYGLLTVERLRTVLHQLLGLLWNELGTSVQCSLLLLVSHKGNVICYDMDMVLVHIQ
jgi:hypothetical protein